MPSGNVTQPESPRASSPASHGIAPNVSARWSSVSTTITFGRRSARTSATGHSEPRAECDERRQRRARHPPVGRGGAHSFRTFQMCSAGKARAHSSGA